MCVCVCVCTHGCVCKMKMNDCTNKGMLCKLKKILFKFS